MTYRTSEDLAQQTSPFRRLVYGMIRRLAITLTAEARWQLLGQRGGEGGDEILQAEPFTGIGFYSRPASSGNPEAVVVAVGGAKTTVIVATRDEATRQAVAGDLPDDSTAMFNTKAIIVINPDSTVEIRTPGGTADALVTQSQFMNHTHTTAGTGPPTPPTALSPSPPLTGTTVLKAQ